MFFVIPALAKHAKHFGCTAVEDEKISYAGKKHPERITPRSFC